MTGAKCPLVVNVWSWNASSMINMATEFQWRIAKREMFHSDFFTRDYFLPLNPTPNVVVAKMNCKIEKENGIQSFLILLI